MLSNRRLDLQGLINLVGMRSKNKLKSRSGRLKLSHRVLFQKLVVFERMEALAVEQSMQMGEGLQSEQRHRVSYGCEVLPRSPIHYCFRLL